MMNKNPETKQERSPVVQHSGFGIFPKSFPKPFDTFERVFGNMRAFSLFGHSENIMNPKCDLEETADHYNYILDVPGVPKNQIDIEIIGNDLVVSAERKRQTESSSAGFRRTERFHGKFSRTIALPWDSDRSNIKAFHENGVLHITVLKSPEMKRHSIDIIEGHNGLPTMSQPATKEQRDMKGDVS